METVKVGSCEQQVNSNKTTNSCESTNRVISIPEKPKVSLFGEFNRVIVNSLIHCEENAIQDGLPDDDNIVVRELNQPIPSQFNETLANQNDVFTPDTSKNAACGAAKVIAETGYKLCGKKFPREALPYLKVEITPRDSEPSYSPQGTRRSPWE